jgi:beta-galactosidase GanA
MDWPRHNRCLDRVGASMYSDVAHYNWNVARFDRLRAEKPAPYWLLETAPNWSGGGRLWNIHHDARGVRVMSWMSTLLGGTMTLFWQWRQHWAGQEIQHGTHVTATGRWRPNREAWAQLAREYAAHGAWLLQHPPLQARLGLLYNSEAAWAFSIDPIDEDMAYPRRWCDDYYLPLLRQHLWRDVVHDGQDFAPYKVLLAPHMPILAEDTRRRLKEWVAQGGRLLLGPLTGYRTEEFTVSREHEFNGLEELMGAESALGFTVQWVEDRVKVDFGDGLTTPTRTWCDAFHLTTGAALGHYRGGYGDGRVAAVRHNFGRGTVITLGCRVSEAVYLKLVRALMDETGLAPLAAGAPEVLIAPRAGADGKLAGYGVVNLSEAPREVTLGARGRDLLTGRMLGPELRLAPLEVLVLEVRE